MKNFINQANQVVQESLLGALRYENIAVLDNPNIKVVVRKDWQQEQVSIISGGGSGHEPAHIGFIGKGMLTAAVCGEVFASPSVDAVLSAILATTGQSGCLVIIKNYTGDRLNFGLAIEQAKALGHQVEAVIVGDDISLGLDVQRRGIAGTIFVHKLAGAMAEAGKSLAEIKKKVEETLAEIYSIGLSLSPCETFAEQKKDARIAEDQVELGMGIHGESGVETIKFAPVAKLLPKMTDKLQKYMKKDRQYALLVNNLGSSTSLEMNIIIGELSKTKFFTAISHILGPAVFMSALNMHGISLSIIALDQEIIQYLSAETSARYSGHHICS